ncbi:MAG: Hsp20/alpha crystallin family protein [Patescibacteria group bacterium]|jgi:HSP20 family protein|nr:Hsp20/alpha crystallin family protein [Patescibacteria group bacterium]
MFPFWDEEDKLFEDLTPSLYSNAQNFVPAIDVYQTKDDVVVETALSGVKPEDVEISIENDVLTIKGQAKKETEIDEKNYYRKEMRTGSFHRSVVLPTHVISDKAEATSKDGVLKIAIPKAPESKIKTIKVKVEKK